MSNRTLKPSLLATTIIAGMAMATPAFAQDATTAAPPPPGTQPEQATPPTDSSGPNPGTTAKQAPVQQTNKGSTSEEIVVTGTLLRRTTAETPSPVTVVSSESMAQRGINTVAEAVQRVSANNAGTIQAGWNTGFNFATGATAPSLRGLTVQDTVTLFDGLRMAVYPLADDGERNFVDTNTIPTAIVDRVEILRDGASSTYGADAIAGVVNIITKKEVQGLHLNGNYGISQHGGGNGFHVDATAGYGDLDNQGFNVYVSGEWQKDDVLWARDRDFPFNTQDLSSYCNGAGACLQNLNWNGISADGTFNGNISIPGITLVRPQAAPGAATGAGRFQFLDLAKGCGPYPEVHPVSGSAPLNAAGQVTSCEVNFQHDYIQLAPEIQRKGLSGRATFRPAENHEIFIEGNVYWTNTNAEFTPLGFNGTPVPPIPAGLPAYNVMLPVYVCANGAGTFNGTNTGCNASNGVLDPYNPFAAQGMTAQAFVRNTRPRAVETRGRALRGVIGASGDLGAGFTYNASLTGSEFRLRRIQSGYLIPQRIMDAVARGQINFLDLEATPENVWDYISPDSNVVSTSNLWQANGTISKDLLALPGGPLGLAVGLSYRHEGVDAPSANPALNNELGVPDPTQNQYNRYLSLNAVGTEGQRNVKSAYFELDAPFFDLRQNGFGAEVNVSGRYDSYSTGQKNFSPKVGVKVTPIRQIALRGTWSKGFRIPSFQESFGTPTTGYVGRGGGGPTGNFCTTYAAFCAAHAFNAYASNAFPVGLTQVGNPNLEPEKSTSFTAGLILEPIPQLSFTIDWYKIKIKNLILGSSPSQQAQAFDQYFSNNGVVNVPGVTVLPAAPDPAFPAALPLLGFILSPFQNANSETVSGIDFGANFRHRFGAVRWTSNLEASYLHRYVLNDGGTKVHYEGSLSPCNITSCSGSPQWRGDWQNTVDFNNTTLSLTVYYTGPYGNESTDFGATKGDCESGIAFGSVVTYTDGTPYRCRAKPVWNVDFTGSQKVTPNLTIYGSVLNIFDINAPFDKAAAYGLFNYNPAWAGPNILGRFFKIGAKWDLNPAPPPPPPVVEAPPPPPPPPAPPATQTCADGTVILATATCPAPPPPPPPAPAPERGF